ncbi:MAG TPA: hypothetical protein VI076_16945 [Actinopolymorphaceae bacterium]
MPDASPLVTSVPASFWTSALRRQAFLIAFFLVLGAAAGVGIAIGKGEEYTSTAAILIDPLEGNPYSPDGRGEQLVNLRTEAALVTTTPVTKLVNRKLRTDFSEQDLRRQVLVEVPTNTQVLEISFTAGGGPQARAGAQAFAEAYLQYRKQRAQSIIASDLERVRRQQTSVRTSVSKTAAELRSTELSQSRRTYLEEKLSALSAQLSGLETQESSLQARDLRPGQLITAAPLPPPAGPGGMVLFGAGGGAGGLLLGFLLAIARARADDRIHEAIDVEQLSVPVLGIAQPRFGTRRTDRKGSVSYVPGRNQEMPESYRDLRTALVTSADDPPVCLALLAASRSVTTAPEAAGLGLGLARAGFRVCVIDTIGETTWLLGGRGRLRGLGELLVEGADLRRLLAQPEDGLTVLPLGRVHSHTMDRLLSPQMRRAVHELVSQNDYVLIAGGSATGADGRAVASLAGSVVLVANRHVTTRARLSESALATERVGAELLGAVVVDSGPALGPARRFLRFVLGPFGRRGKPARPAYDADLEAGYYPQSPQPQSSAGHAPGVVAPPVGGAGRRPTPGKTSSKTPPTNPTRVP